MGLLALGVYLRTLYPGLVGIGDTPKFQYVGAVLGTPHNPGYPLYLMLSHVFGLLPVGTLAFRINLLSALSATGCVVLLYGMQRQLDTRKPVAAAVALTAAFGPVLWSQATLAEVYALAALLLAGILLPLLAWGRQRRPGLLLAAAGIFALGLGHHLTLVTLAPALLLYAALVDRQQALCPRMLVAAAGLQVLGLAQYLLILVRTVQGAPYLGSQARNLGELLDVMRGAQFTDRLFAFDLRSVLFERLPHMARLVWQELGTAGVGVALLGLAVLARWRPREAVLLMLGLAGPLVFILNYRVDDPEVFLIPCFILTWPLVGVGLDALLARAARLSVVHRRRGVPAALAALSFLLPAHQLATHLRASDHHDRTFEMRYFRALFEQLPARSVVLAESYTVDQMVLYEILGEGFGERKGVRLSAADGDSVRTYAGRGRAVYAFRRSHDALALDGFLFEPVRVWDARAAGPPRSFSQRPFPLFRLTDLPDCVAIGNLGWHDVTAQARTGRLLVKLDNRDPHEARLVMYLATEQGREPTLLRRRGRGRPRVSTRHFRSQAALREAMTADGLSAAASAHKGNGDGVAAFARVAQAWRLEVQVNDQGAYSALTLDLGGRPRRALARAEVDRPNPDRGRLCRAARR